MALIFESKQAKKQLKYAPENIQKSYEAWVSLLRVEGSNSLRIFKGYHDEKLLGAWKGCRSSRLNRAWRVIYKVERSVIEIVTVIRISKHDYKV